MASPLRNVRKYSCPPLGLAVVLAACGSRTGLDLDEAPAESLYDTGSSPSDGEVADAAEVDANKYDGASEEAGSNEATVEDGGEGDAGADVLAICRAAHDNIIAVTGDKADWVYAGSPTWPGIGPYVLSPGEWAVRGPLPDVTLTVHGCIGSVCTDWELSLASGTASTPIGVGAYVVDGSDSGPMMNLAGNGHGCDRSVGRFVVEEFSYDSAGIRTILAFVEQHCGSVTPSIRACVRFAG